MNRLAQAFKQLSPIISSVINSQSMDPENDTQYCLNEAFKLYKQTIENTDLVSELTGQDNGALKELCITLIANEWQSFGYLSLDWSDMVASIIKEGRKISDQSVDHPVSPTNGLRYMGDIISIINSLPVQCNKREAILQSMKHIENTVNNCLDTIKSQSTDVISETVTQTLYHAASMIFIESWTLASQAEIAHIATLDERDRLGYAFTDVGRMFLSNTLNKFTKDYNDYVLSILALYSKG